MSSARQRDLVMGGVAALIILVDQLTKHWVVSYFVTPGLHAPIPLIAHLLEFEYIQNTGAAFSLLAGQAQLFLFIAVAVGVIAYLYWRTRHSPSVVLRVAFGLVLGGACGNVIDRIIHTYVVDFIYFHVGTAFEWPVFNVADSAISVGVVLLALLLWRGSADVARPESSTVAEARPPLDHRETPMEASESVQAMDAAASRVTPAHEITPGE